MLQSPADEGGDMGHEGLPAGGEAVLNSRRHFGINLSNATANYSFLGNYANKREIFLEKVAQKNKVRLPSRTFALFPQRELIYLLTFIYINSA